MLTFRAVEERLTVIREEQDDRVVGQPERIHGFDDAADVVVDVTHRRVVTRERHAPSSVRFVEAARSGERVVGRIVSLDHDEGATPGAAESHEFDAPVRLDVRPVLAVRDPADPVRLP